MRSGGVIVAVKPKHNRRKARTWWSLFWRMGGYGVVICAVLWLALTIPGHFSETMAERFARDGLVTMGQVVDRRHEISTDSDGDETHSFYLTLRYNAGGMGVLQREVSVNSGLYAASPMGADVELRYLPGVVEAIEVPVGKTASTARWLVRIGTVFGVAALIMLWFFGKRATLAVKARRDGEAGVGEVVEVRATSVSVNNETQARLIWRGPDGEEGQSLMRGITELRKIPVGAKINIYRFGDQMWWEGDVGPRNRTR